MSHKQTPESFWARVKKTSSCWEWSGALNTSGYGSVGWCGAQYSAHRVAAWLSGLVDSPAAPSSRNANTFVLHKCDNRKCCNPAHFFIGTHGDNMLDAYSKNRKRQLRGEAHTNAKLTNADARSIRRLYAQGTTQVEIARRFGVSQRVVSLITRGESYKCA